MPSPLERIIPVILSGGSGTRLWPMSTPETPKQFLALTGDRTMFQLTADRCADQTVYAPPMIVANKRHAALISDQLHHCSGMDGARLVLEPCARNTAPAIALAAIAAGPAPMLVMPSDHVIADEHAFQAAIQQALPLAREGWLVTFGITPDAPETGYGYIEIGESVGPDIHRVKRFIEKPERAKAEAMLAAGGHAWNGGIFLFSGDAFMASLDAHAPEIARCARAAMDGATTDGALLHPEEAAFAASPSDSIDYAVMERADKVAVVPVAMGWSDLGSWDALYGIADRDDAGNALSGEVRLVSGANNLVKSDGVRVSIAGVSDLIVIARGNEVMILPRGQSQEVKKFSN
jgi:mannose-1-phosphate guanylyltransferase